MVFCKPILNISQIWIVENSTKHANWCLKISKFLDLVAFCSICVIFIRSMYNASTTSGWHTNKLQMSMRPRARYVSSWHSSTRSILEHVNICFTVFSPNHFDFIQAKSMSDYWTKVPMACKYAKIIWILLRHDTNMDRKSALPLTNMYSFLCKSKSAEAIVFVPSPDGPSADAMSNL